MMPATKYHPGTKQLVSFSSIELSSYTPQSIFPVSAVTFLRQKSVTYCPEKDGLKNEVKDELKDELEDELKDELKASCLGLLFRLFIC